jgi:hypothetical protein
MPKRLIIPFALIVGLALLSLAATQDPASAKGDHKALQGKWERPLTSGDPESHGGSRAVKEVSGSREKVTYFNDAGEAVYVTTADFKVEGRPPVRLYVYSNFKIEKGKPKGSEPPEEPVAYIYRVDGDLYHEGHGLLDTSPPGSNPVVVTWKRVK